MIRRKHFRKTSEQLGVCGRIIQYIQQGLPKQNPTKNLSSAYRLDHYLADGYSRGSFSVLMSISVREFLIV
jgi:hypothetical protein